MFAVRARTAAKTTTRRGRGRRTPGHQISSGWEASFRVRQRRGVCELSTGARKGNNSVVATGRETGLDEGGGARAQPGQQPWTWEEGQQTWYSEQHSCSQSPRDPLFKGRGHAVCGCLRCAARSSRLRRPARVCVCERRPSACSAAGNARRWSAMPMPIGCSCFLLDNMGAKKMAKAEPSKRPLQVASDLPRGGRGGPRLEAGWKAKRGLKANGLDGKAPLPPPV
jgi:hypothetical protein